MWVSDTTEETRTELQVFTLFRSTDYNHYNYHNDNNNNDDDSSRMVSVDVNGKKSLEENISRKSLAGAQWAQGVADSPGLSWAEAKQRCEEEGAVLASIVSWQIQVGRE